jgi:hypothetical protein
MTSPDKPPYTVHIPGLTEAIRAHMADPRSSFGATFREMAAGLADLDDDQDPSDATPIQARKYAGLLPVSVEQLMDEGLIPDTRPPVHIPRRTRARRWIRSTAAGARLRAGSWIAGVDLDHECEH